MLCLQDIVNHLRMKSHTAVYGGSMPAPVALQIMMSMKMIMGEECGNEGIVKWYYIMVYVSLGQKRVAQLIENSR